MPCVYQESQALPYFFIEDVFIGGFVAERCQVEKLKKDFLRIKFTNF
jgi:hypothetical protein